MEEESQDWVELRQLIRYRLDQLDKHIVALNKTNMETNNKISALSSDIANLKGRAAAWGAMAGVVGGGIVAIIVSFLS